MPVFMKQLQLLFSLYLRPEGTIPIPNSYLTSDPQKKVDDSICMMFLKR